MLRNKDGMPAHRRLLAVVHRMRGREPPLHEIAPVLQDRRQPLGREIRALARPQPKAPAKG